MLYNGNQLQPQPQQQQIISHSHQLRPHPQQYSNGLTTHPQHQYNVNNGLIQDKMWEDITASICDDFVSIKTEPTHQNTNRYPTNANNMESIHSVQPNPQPIYHSYMRHSSNIQSSSQSIYGNIVNNTFNNNVMSTNLTPNLSSIHHSNRVLLYLPPTPPNSEPGSPSTQQQQQRQQQQHSHPHHAHHTPAPHQPPRRTPPPPYNTCANNPNGIPLHHQMASMTTTMHVNSTRLSNSHQQSGVNTTPNLTQPRYNRRNNPELEKRRIHRCDYPGMFQH